MQLLFGTKTDGGYSGTSSGTKAWENEIRDAVKAYDPDYELTPQDERLIRKKRTDYTATQIEYAAVLSS